MAVIPYVVVVVPVRDDAVGDNVFAYGNEY
jgi:hypothetical protein